MSQLDRIAKASGALHRALCDYGIAIGNGFQCLSIDTECDAIEHVRAYILADYARGKHDGLTHYYGEPPANDI